LGWSSDLYTPHPFYFGLGDDDSPRQEHYRALFLNHFEAVMLNKIRATVNRCLAVGDGLFVEQVEQLTQQRLSPAKRGRPKKKR
jgi:REP-associated tyrosine transposase